MSSVEELSLTVKLVLTPCLSVSDHVRLCTAKVETCGWDRPLRPPAV